MKQPQCIDPPPGGPLALDFDESCKLWRLGVKIPDKDETEFSEQVSKCLIEEEEKV